MISLKLAIRGVDLSRIPNPVGSAARYSVRVESDVSSGKAVLRGEPIDIVMLLKYWGMKELMAKVQASVQEGAERSDGTKQGGRILFPLPAFEAVSMRDEDGTVKA